MAANPVRLSSLALRCISLMENYAGKGHNDSLDLLLVANKRKPNFTEGESLYLISQFERNAKVLTSKLNDASTNKQKVEVWKRICSDYNSKNPIVLRTANDLKRKWKNMVRAAKKELLESMTPSENGEQSVSQRKLSPVSQRIVEILRITTTNCGTVLTSAGLENSFDGSFAEADQGENAFEAEEDGSMNEFHRREENGVQHVVHVVVGQDVKPSVLASPVNTEQMEESQQNHNGDSQFSVNTETASNAEVQATTGQEVDVPQGNSTVPGKSAAVPVSVVSVSSIPEVRHLPSTSSTSRTNNPARHHRVLVPQQKRMLPSSISHVIKKRKLSEFGYDESLSHVREEIERLKKDKLILEKEKLALEKEKLIMEKEKLALEIRFLHEQMD